MPPFLFVLLLITHVYVSCGSIPEEGSHGHGSHFLSHSELSLQDSNPSHLGFPSVQRNQDAKPFLERYCLAGNKVFPLPTNSWWIPAVRPTANPAQPNYITPLPYVYDLTPQEMRFSYPILLVTARHVQNILNRFWSVSAEQTSALGYLSHYCVTKFDEFSATFRWSTRKDQNDGNSIRNLFESTIMRGSPYITTKYTESQPKIHTQQGPRKIWFDDVLVECTGKDGVKVHQVLVQFIDSDEEWFIWFPPQTSVICDAGPDHFTLTTVEAVFSGIVRLALANNCSTGMPPLSSHCASEGEPNPHPEAYKEALIHGSDVCHTGGSTTSKLIARSMVYTIAFQSSKCWGHGKDDMLMIALPHHISRLDHKGVTVLASGGHNNTRGYSTPVVGHTWNLVLPWQEVEWIEEVDHSKRHQIKHVLTTQDKNLDLPPDGYTGAIDPYNAGKLMARLGRLALIAHELGETKIVHHSIDRLKRGMAVWLDHKSFNPLIYDATWGGLISCGCMYAYQNGYGQCTNGYKKLECPSLFDFGQDFGNGFFNDHHFHYGYFIYTAAVIAKFDRHWASKYNDKVGMFIRDIANPKADRHFSAYRHFDWYLGHSYASGIIPQPNGRNQESISEAINAYYAINLYGRATNQPHITKLGDSLLFMEAHSVQHYWHGAHGVFPGEYRHNLVGIQHDLLYEFQTFFGDKPYYVNGIHLLPITPALRLIMPSTWMEIAYPAFSESCDTDQLCEDSGFVTFARVAQALIGGQEKKNAWESALKLPASVFAHDNAGGNGNTLTATLWFIAAKGETDGKAEWANDNSDSTEHDIHSGLEEAEHDAAVALWWSCILWGVAAISLSFGGYHGYKRWNLRAREYLPLEPFSIFRTDEDNFL